MNYLRLVLPGVALKCSRVPEVITKHLSDSTEYPLRTEDYQISNPSPCNSEASQLHVLGSHCQSAEVGRDKIKPAIPSICHSNLPRRDAIPFTIVVLRASGGDAHLYLIDKPHYTRTLLICNLRG